MFGRWPVCWQQRTRRRNYPHAIPTLSSRKERPFTYDGFLKTVATQVTTLAVRWCWPLVLYTVRKAALKTVKFRYIQRCRRRNNVRVGMFRGTGYRQTARNGKLNCWTDRKRKDSRRLDWQKWSCPSWLRFSQGKQSTLGQFDRWTTIPACSWS